MESGMGMRNRIRRVRNGNRKTFESDTGGGERKRMDMEQECKHT
jgi:hypothetical protein